MSKKSTKPTSQRIITEQKAKHRQILETEDHRQFMDQPRAELRRAWDHVGYWLRSDCSVASQDALVPASPDVAVHGIARLNKALVACNLLIRLAEPPIGIEGDDLDSWSVACDILRFAADKPAEAEQLLISIRGLPFASKVRDWLCGGGFRRVVEGDWHDGGLVRNLFGLEPEISNADHTARQDHGEADVDRSATDWQGCTAADTDHSDDFRFVRWYGTEYVFTPTQAACIRVLWEAWKKGTPVLGQAAILEAADSRGTRLSDVFEKGKHPAWRKMIVCVRKGAFQLAKPV
jgi:hypothetical protein